MCVEVLIRRMVNLEFKCLSLSAFGTTEGSSKPETRVFWFFFFNLRLYSQIHNISYSEAFLLHIEVSELKS